jgi:hypothetical protein
MNEIIKALAIELTIITGETWRTDLTERHNHLRSESAHLYIYQQWNTKNRLNFRASVPQEMKELRTTADISCSIDRTPQAIAQDISNRLLPHARKHLAESTTYDLQERKKDAKNNLRKNLIMRYLPKEYDDKKFCTDTKGYKERIYAHETYNDLINIEINLPLPAALKLLKLITKEYIN